MAFFHRILEKPHVHDLCQRVMAIGRGRCVYLTEQFLLTNARGRILDLGCGTARYAHLFSKGYVGLDINPAYLEKKPAPGRVFVCADSQAMPFADGLFDTVFSVGLFHHLDPQATRSIFKEIIRVSKPGAAILLVDFFYPDIRFDLPGWLVSRLDRGSRVRHRQDFMREINSHFEVIESFYIQRSYPYNLNAFVLKIKPGL